MIVKAMKAIIYTDGGRKWHKEIVKSPDWDSIGPAILRLDKFAYPIVSLFLSTEVDDVPDFEIMGGKGDWHMFTNLHERRFHNPMGNPEKEIWVWTSDQGASTTDDFCCHDIEVVLKAARYFYENGVVDPSMQWES